MSGPHVAIASGKALCVWGITRRTPSEQNDGGREKQEVRSEN